MFFGGFVIGSVFEYICSVVQEALLGTVSWKYDHMPLNLNGRINVMYSMFWGILALLWVKNLFPLMTRLIEKIPNSIGKILTWILLVFMILNTIVSGLAVARWTARDEGVPPANAMEEFLDHHYSDDFMKMIYPNMMPATIG